MKTPLAEELVDAHNRWIWDELEKEYNLVLKTHTGRLYYFEQQLTEIFLYIPSKDINKQAFTHELLHLLLQHRKIRISSYLIQCFKNEPLLCWSLNENLFDQIGHYLEHTKMFPLYLKCGFDAGLFSEDFNEFKCSPMNLQLISSGMQKPVPSLASADLFINKFFAMKCCSNENMNHTPYLERLEALCPSLYSILQSFWIDWKQFNVDGLDSVNYSYTSFTKQFIHELGQWAARRIQARIKFKRISAA